MHANLELASGHELPAEAAMLQEQGLEELRPDETAYESRMYEVPLEEQLRRVNDGEAYVAWLGELAAKRIRAAVSGSLQSVR